MSGENGVSEDEIDHFSTFGNRYVVFNSHMNVLANPSVQWVSILCVLCFTDVSCNGAAGLTSGGLIKIITTMTTGGEVQVQNNQSIAK